MGGEWRVKLMGFGREFLQGLSEKSVLIASRQILKSIQKGKSMQGSRHKLERTCKKSI